MHLGRSWSYERNDFPAGLINFTGRPDLSPAAQHVHSRETALSRNSKNSKVSSQTIGQSCHVPQSSSTRSVTLRQLLLSLGSSTIQTINHRWFLWVLSTASLRCQPFLRLIDGSSGVGREELHTKVHKSLTIFTIDGGRLGFSRILRQTRLD